MKVEGSTETLGLLKHCTYSYTISTRVTFLFLNMFLSPGYRTIFIIISLQNTPLFHHIPPFPPVLIASVMLCAISSLNLVSPLGAWSFRPVLHKDSRLLRPTRLHWWRLTKPLHALILVACLLPHQSRTLPIT